MGIRHIIAWVKKYEARLSFAALVAGFVVDNLTLTRIDLRLDNLILISYIALAALGIAIINLYEGGVLRGRLFQLASFAAPIPIQYAFGGLFSGFVVFYSRSSSLITSWPFLLILAALLVGNEFFRERYKNLTFQASILFIAIFSYMVFAVPVLVRSIGSGVFLLSGVVSVAVIMGFLYGLEFFIPKHVREIRSGIIKRIGGIILLMNALYFLNIIPPIPLSLKEAGAYHAITRAGSEYRLVGEEKPWYAFVRVRDVLRLVPGDAAWVWSAVFAPSRLSADIVHHWQWLDGNGRWVTMSRLSFPITGGRDGGYRGYSRMQNVAPGLWRVNIETPRGQLLGRVKFRVDYVDTLPALKTLTR